MKNLLLLLFVICLLSCKTKEPVVNNTAYTTTVGELVTDLPRSRSIYSNTFTSDSDTIINHENIKEINHSPISNLSKRKTTISNESKSLPTNNIGSFEIKNSKGKNSPKKNKKKDKDTIENNKRENENVINEISSNNHESIGIETIAGIEAVDISTSNDSSDIQKNKEKNKNSTIQILDISKFSWEAGIRLTQIVDIRSLQEYKSGHIFDAINIDINSSSFVHLIQNLDKTSPVALYGRSEIDELKAAKILEKKGFSIIYVLEGGIHEWIKAKKELFK
ncbi:rhodanese-like domain-containing protein [Apibacter muscae]|uniref:rhodanese-like domain-containing protein n=1 Tax=Apibacter muscae TaxID=2509004 RepID=UPI0011AC6940|nr:rhodanese-like domain-containing protein [Apibacter muscae]TWP30204.1 rhodanese-like domain-containing protein [Apibacter muscae]